MSKIAEVIITVELTQSLTPQGVQELGKKVNLALSNTNWATLGTQVLENAGVPTHVVDVKSEIR